MWARKTSCIRPAGVCEPPAGFIGRSIPPSNRGSYLSGQGMWKTMALQLAQMRWSWLEPPGTVIVAVLPCSTCQSKDTLAPGPKEWSCEVEGLHSHSLILGFLPYPRQVSVKGFKVTAGQSQWVWGDLRGRKLWNHALWTACLGGEVNEMSRKFAQFKSWLHHLSLLPGTE